MNASSRSWVWVRRGHVDRLALAATACLGTAIAIGTPASLPNAEPCRGLVAFVTIVMARTSRDVAIGDILSTQHLILLFLALVVVTRLVRTLTSSTLVAVAVGLVAAASPVFLSAWSPAPAAAVASFGVCVLVSLRLWRKPSVAAIELVCLAGMAAVAAAVVPRLALPAAVCTAVILWQLRASGTRRTRVAWAAAAATGVLALPVAVLAMTTSASPMACLWPPPAGPEAGSLIEQFRDASGATMLIAVLAGLGGWALLLSDALARRTVLLLSSLAAVTALFAAGDPAAWAPTLLVFWSLAARGLVETRTALSDTARHRAGFLALLALTAGLQIHLALSGEAVEDLQPRGHETWSQHTFVDLIGRTPEGASLVSEDAMTDLLVRALPSRTRERRHLGTIPLDAASVRAALAGSRVYALPRAQLVLRQFGFQLIPVADAGGPLAEVTAGLPCTLALDGGWRSVPEVTTSAIFTLIATDRASRGPVYLFAASERQPSVSAIGWPSAALRGFHARTLDLSHAPDRAAIESELATFGAAGDIAERLRSAAQFVTRIELWRTPEAPLRLTVGLGEAPSTVVARLADEATGGHVSLCPSPPPAFPPR